MDKILALFAFVLEYFGFYHSSIFVGILIHVFVVVVLSYFLYRSYQAKKDLRFPILLWLAILAGGVFGAGGFLLFACLIPLYSYFAIPPSQMFKQLFPFHSYSAFEGILQRVNAKWDDYAHLAEVSSFQDIFQYGTVAQKQAVLDSCATEFSSGFGPIVRQALQDPDNNVRIQASAIIAKIESNFEKDLTQLLAQVVQKPKDPQLLLTLAKHYEAFADLGLLDPLRTKENQHEAIRYYQEIEPKDASILLSLGRLLFHVGNFERYLVICQEYQKHNGSLPALMRSWYLEALYRLGRTDELSAFIRESQ